MDIQIKQGPQCHPSNCYTYRNGDIKYIVIHFTSNNGDTALNNCNYFSGANRGASAHYFIGDDGIYQSVPDKWVHRLRLSTLAVRNYFPLFVANHNMYWLLTRSSSCFDFI